MRQYTDIALIDDDMIDMRADELVMDVYDNSYYILRNFATFAKKRFIMLLYTLKLKIKSPSRIMFKRVCGIKRLF